MLKLNGKPLIHYTIRAAQKSKMLDGYYLSSDDISILKYAKDINCPTISRPKNLSKDKTPTIKVLLHADQYLKKNIILMLIFLLHCNQHLHLETIMI